MATTSTKLAKSSTVVAVAASTLAIAPKLASSKFDNINWIEAKKRFGKQVLGRFCPGQRAQIAQVTHGWNHIKGEALTSQSTIQVVEYTGAYKKACKFKQVLIDGFHRVYYWMSLESDKVLDACPFAALNIEIHTIHANTQYEADMKTDALARSYNSHKSSKQNGDFLSAAVLDACLDAQSIAYQTGRGTGIASFLKRVVGDADTPTPLLTQIAAKNLKAHECMDSLIALVESSRVNRKLRSGIFNPGVMQAVFIRLAELTDVEANLATGQFADAFSRFATPALASVSAPTAVVERIMDLLEQMSCNTYVQKLVAKGSRETQYNILRDALKVPFRALGKRSMRGLSSTSL